MIRGIEALTAKPGVKLSWGRGERTCPCPSLPCHAELESLQTPDEKEALNNIFDAINKSWNKTRMFFFSYHPQLEGQEARRH